MKKQINPKIQAHLRQSTFYLLLLLTVCALPFALGQRNATKPEAPTKFSQRSLTFEERVSYQQVIEEVYWRHRIWPKDRPDPKPSLDPVMTQAQLERKVADYLRNSQALEYYWQRPITSEQLQGEMDRMAQHTRQPDVLRELFEALGNDAFVIAECLARPVISERLVTTFHGHERNEELLESWRARAQEQVPTVMVAINASYTLPTIADGATACIDDTWTATTTTNAPSGRVLHTAVWTGVEMIVWGGGDLSGNLNTGGRYSPATDSWTATSTSNGPARRVNHAAVWTGNEMIVWGGFGDSGEVNTGGKYNPGTDNWTATSPINAPDARQFPTAVWIATEMIVWGGLNANGPLNTGGRYNPGTDSWTATSTTNAPDARAGHTAVRTRSEMIVWGGYYGGSLLNTGGRYNPGTDSWTATSATNAPSERFAHTAVWTGGEMIIWGGTCGRQCGVDYNTGGRYNPSADSWTATNTINAPSARNGHTAIWTGGEMIVWGGEGSLNTGGRYNSSADSWTATNTTNAPSGRDIHTAIWTGSEMIIWGGTDGLNLLNIGGRYCAQSGPTPTPTPMPTATATPTATPTVTPRPSPTPRLRPTPHPRPTS